MNDHSDAVDDVLAAFDEHLAHRGPRPTLDHLAPGDRQVAEELMRLMETARSIDPAASAPSLESLLAGTPFVGALATLSPVPSVLHQVQDVVAGVDPRVEVSLDGEGFVSFAYLDLLAHFYPVDSDEPTASEEALRALFDDDVDVDLVGLVAMGTSELLTRVVSRYDVDPTVSTSASRPYEPAAALPLPLVLAARSILEQSAPEWGEFGLAEATLEIDIVGLQTEIANVLVAEESKRRYQGDKALAYRSLAGHEHRLVHLVATASRPDAGEAAAELDRTARQVA
jgi:hypothetical protein